MTNENDRSAARRGTETIRKERAATYDACYAAVTAIWEDEGGATLDEIALMATINSVLANHFPQFLWTGFYRLIAGRLVIGPYIGTVGCLQIAIGRGVCGTAAEKRETVIAPDVRAFPGHIACDPNSKSEIVVPVVGRSGELLGVLDVDSDRLDAFDDSDREGLEKIVSLFAR